MGLIIAGKVWKFGDHISTDYMAPSFDMEESWGERKRHILHIHDTFTREFQPGEVIVAGKNFGCGSSRESAPANLKRLGIGCVVAESFGRIFFRNCMAIALPALAFKGASGLFEEGDHLELDFENAVVKNLSKGDVLKGTPLPPELVRIVRKGGLLASLRSECQTDG